MCKKVLTFYKGNIFLTRYFCFLRGFIFYKKVFYERICVL